MTSANHDMPPRQPEESKPADKPAPDVLDFIDETVARITDTDVDDRLRDVLSQAGYRSRHTGVTPPQQAADRPAPDTRRRVFSRFLIFLSGAVPEIVNKIPRHERIKFESRGWAMLITGGMAAVSMWFTLASAMGVNGIVAVPFALLWGLAIMVIDRWLVISMPVSSTLRMLVAAAPRLALALLVGTLISTPMVLRIFQQAINAEIPVIRQQQVSQFLASPQHSQLNHQVSNLELQVQSLNQVIFSGGQVSVNPATDPLVQSLTARRTHEIALEQTYYQKWQCEVTGTQGQGCSGSSGLAGNGALARDLQVSYETAAAQVNELTGQIQDREAQLTANNETAAATRVSQAEQTLPEVKKQLKTAQDQLNTVIESFTAQNSTDNGLLIRLQALNQLANNDAAVNVARLTLFLLFLVIECLPVTVTLLQRPGNYERILAREIIDARLKEETLMTRKAIDARLKAAAALEEQLQSRHPAAGQEEHPASEPQEPAQARTTSGTEPVAVPDHLKDQINSIYPFMTDPGETTAPAYREELENCFLAISQVVDELRRKGFDSDQIADALRTTANVATRQLTAAWQSALERQPLS